MVSQYNFCYIKKIFNTKCQQINFTFCQDDLLAGDMICHGENLVQLDKKTPFYVLTSGDIKQLVKKQMTIWNQ